MSGAPEVYKAVLTVHDFFHYISREMKIGVTAPYINSSALMYALNVHHRRQSARLVSGLVPHYRDDFASFTIYATPAVLSMQTPRVVRNELRKELVPFGGETVKITYNSVDETLAVSMELPKRLNVPKQGAYYKFTPLSTFVFYVIGGRGPGLIRIGKKLIQARVSYIPLRCKRRRGTFRPSHPVPVVDLKHYEIMGGVWENILPYPILVDAVLKGEHLECGNDRVILPPGELYANLKL